MTRLYKATVIAWYYWVYNIYGCNIYGNNNTKVRRKKGRKEKSADRKEIKRNMEGEKEE